MGRWLGLVMLAAGCSAPESTVELDDVSFGVVGLNATHHAQLQLFNQSARAARLVRVERRSGPDVFTVTPGPVQLGSGARATWRISFTPLAPGLSQARFAAVFDTGVTEFTLRGRAALPCVMPEFFDVGDARVGGLVSRTLTVSNPLEETADVFVGAAGPPFEVEPSGTLHLERGASREVTVRFSPSAPGTPTMPWVVRPGADCTDTVVALTGRALSDSVSFSSGRLDFGALAAGASRSMSVELRNHSRTPVAVSAMRFTSAAFRSSTEVPLVIPAEGAVVLEVEGLAPTTSPFDGVLTVVTDALEQPELSLPLIANRVTPCVALSRERVDFASVEVGCRGRDERIRLTNDCPHDVVLGEASMTPGFALIAALGRTRLSPGEGVELALTSAPASEGARSGALTVPVDVLDGTQVVRVALAGEGAPAAVVEESQTVPREPWMLDVLLVLDDSVTMAPLAAPVQRNLEVFARYLTSNWLDARVGVMTTSTAPGEVGRLRRAPDGSAFLTNPTPSALGALAAVRGLSTTRSSCLEPLLAAFGARDPAELGSLLRPGVGLYVICVTNGPDGLETSPMVAISSLISRLPRPYLFSLIARLSPLGPSADCGGEVEHGPLSALVALNNGVRDEICAPDWARSLERIGRTSFGYRSLFYLQQRPALTRGPLRMWMEGLEVPAVEPPPLGSRIWEYAGELNAVYLEPVYAPVPGSTITFRYPPDCAR